VGLYVTPIGIPANTPDEGRALAFVEPFRPIHVRFTWSVGSASE
jgi:hypothetical protein